MAEHTLYSGPAGNGRLVITARPGMAAGYPVWLVRFARCGMPVVFTSEWLPDLSMWGEGRLIPCGRVRQIPPDVLATVEAWLRGRTVTSTEDTTTKEEQ